MTIVYLCAGLLLLSVLIAWYSYRTAFYSPKKRKKDDYAIPKGAQYEKERQRMLSLIRQMDELPYEAVTISAQDGTKLAARYYHVRDGTPLQIQFHGYRGTAVRDFCGGNKLAGSPDRIRLLWISAPMAKAVELQLPLAFGNGWTASAGRNTPISASVPIRLFFCPAFPWELPRF